MNIKNHYLGFIFVTILLPFICNEIKAQDKHFSQFTASPLTINPALAGMINGDYRISGIYRSQWSSVTNHPYKTITAGADMAFLKNKLGENFMGGGIVFYSDIAGDSEYGTNNVQLTGTFHKALGKESQQYISLAVKGGLVQRKINYANLKFGNQYNGEQFDPSRSHRENFSSTRSNYMFGDISAGLLWTYKHSDNINLYTGAMLAHLNRPNQTHYPNESARLPRKFTGIAGGQFTLSKQWRLIPSMMYIYQGKAQEFNFGSYLNFQNQALKSREVTIYGGLWYRWNDAFIPAVKIDYKQYTMGFSYDINISELRTASKYQGGPEISFLYVGAFSDSQKDNYQNVCPRF